MVLLTKAIRQKLKRNGNEGSDHVPVVKLFTPFGSATWLLTLQEPSNEDLLFGLCDLGVGSPELGNVSISWLESLQEQGIVVERDRYAVLDKPVSEYARIATELGRIEV